MKVNWFKFAAPANFYPVAGWLVSVFAVLAAAAILIGLYWGFFETPSVLGGTNPQKEYYRIIFIHVPAAWMSMWLYLVLAGWCAIGLVFNTRLSYMMAAAVAPTGAIFTFLALWTGALWGRPSWGTYWDWDPRLTSELILFFLYLGYIALHSAIDDTRRADKAAALLAIVGLICVPVIFWSINCPDPTQCAALHQRSSLSQMESNILSSMLIMAFGFWMYSFAAAFARLRGIILEREADTAWVQELATKEARR
ncbi:cytochrome c biogenesis protein CcsA [Thiococcus pfennigii]|jgi:heme exporter protein C|uniref:cytochrome c biogenesis protein CcsA n=1 Tax=Thiococcus pfennigii TaxID=1057 RepID=UPI00190644CD|nr:cytochrome c biogenesis protein CcsA [Thiococcus pfennigii]MBK1701791.1 heme ABC transporter permease [Thiococcus pfennigii]MBK1731164.1 heme ABC transporter permease [Thiococcus pfennigii]